MELISTTINPHYVARLLGPIELAREMSQQSDLFDLIDLTNLNHASVLIEELVKPEYIRLTEEWRHKTKESLRYFLQNECGDVISQHCEMIGLAAPEIQGFLMRIWQVLFPNEPTALLSDMKYSKNFNPIKFDQIRFESSPNRSLDESLGVLRTRLHIE